MEFKHNGQTYIFANAMEEIVLYSVKSAIARDTDMCGCEKCYYDVCAMVLNNLGPPKYGTSQAGALFAKASSSSMQAAGVISVEIIKAINLVKEKPGH